MAFHDGFDLPPFPTPQETQLQAEPAIPLEIEWYLRAVEDALSMLERMQQFPRRRNMLLRRASEALAALEELTLGRPPSNDDWQTFVLDMREHALVVARHSKASTDVGTLLQLDLISQRAERAASIAEGALKDYFLRVALSYAA